MLWSVLLVVAAAPLGWTAPQTAEQAEDLDGHKVLRVVPASQQQVDSMRQFFAEHPALDVWQDPSVPGRPVDVRACPSQLEGLQRFFDDLQLQPEEIITDVGRLISEEARIMTDSKRANAEFGWERYYSLDEIYNWLQNLAKNREEVTLIEGGKSSEGRKILGVKIKYQENAPIIFIEAGIHAREWITPATATFLINQILGNDESTEEYRRTAYKSFEWHIFPSTNPDGYHYTHTANRLWRKTRSRNYLCYGADPNRNWPFHWRGVCISGYLLFSEVGASSFPCADTYAGTAPESEPETRGLRRYLDGLLPRVQVYISIHSYSQLILFPWGYTSALTDNHQNLDRVAKAAAAKAKETNGTEFTCGPISTTIYPAAGSTVDYAYAKGIKYAYAFELRDKGQYGFLLPQSQIWAAADETAAAIVTMAVESKN